MPAIAKKLSSKHLAKTQPFTRSKVLEPQGCTNLKLRQLMRQVTQIYDAEMGKVEIKSTQYSLLSFVNKLGPVKPSELAVHIKMDASTLTRNLKPLISAGWVQVAAGPDGRTRLVSLTDSGRLKRSEAHRQWRIAQDGINSLLGKKKVAELHALIDSSMQTLDSVLPMNGEAL